jgi:formylglycine-generating enzyme required for sulfatase activity
MLVVANDGSLMVDRLEIHVTSKDTVLLHNNYRVPSEVSLPASVAIVSNGDATAQAEVSVVAWQLQPGQPNDLPLDRRDAIVTQIPTDRVAALNVVLSARCSDKTVLDDDGNAQSTCGEGQTCDAGDCRSTDVLASELPDYDEQSSDPGSGGSSSTGGRGAGGDDTEPNTCETGCDTPPEHDCESAVQFRAYDQIGSCVEGTCEYASQLITCDCQSGACTSDPCLTVSCESPPLPRCKDESTRTTFAPGGTCSGGSCTYEPIEAACEGATPRCRPAAGDVECVECLTDEDCSEGTGCDTANGTCLVPPSCSGLASICGPNGDQNCCASRVVPGGVFNRFNNPDYPGQVSAFRLDTYEVTVGRFRRFLDDYAPDMIAAGAGKNPNNPNDTGWDLAWDESMPASRSDIETVFTTGDIRRPQWWTATSGDAVAESAPVSSLSWLLAQAFCIWDGGRLPTEAEWSFAASGGEEQRRYPWGDAEPSCELARYQGSCGSPELDGPHRVGAHSPQGDGLFGHADLAGNIWEPVQDAYLDAPPATCDDCATLTGPLGMTVLGGSWYGNPSFLLNSTRRHFSNTRSDALALGGARCARSP